MSWERLDWSWVGSCPSSIIFYIVLKGRALTQVAAPKKKPKQKEDADTEELVPKTLMEQAKEKMTDLERMAALARSQALKLSNADYAVELTKELETRAADYEKLYKLFQNCVDANRQGKLKDLMKIADEQEAAGVKAKA